MIEVRTTGIARNFLGPYIYFFPSWWLKQFHQFFLYRLLVWLG